MLDLQQSDSCIRVGLLRPCNEPVPCLPVQLFALHYNNNNSNNNNADNSNNDDDNKIVFQLTMS